MHIEIRAGEGGQDAALFAAELADAFTAYATRQGWPVTPVHSPDSRTLVLTVPGSHPGLERFAGTHRVQRVPVGDKHGRRHTSTATVAVLPDPDTAAAVLVRDADVRTDFFRGSGPGGQHRNKTSTAVRLTHRPTGIVVTRTSGRSQSTNLADARADLEGRLQEAARQRQSGTRSGARRGQIAAADRPAKSFTHNQQRDEVRCHDTGARWSLRAFGQGRWA